MNASCVTAKTAGTESTAKIRSVVSTASSTNARGVSARRPLEMVIKRPPSGPSETWKNLRAKRMAGLSCGRAAAGLENPQRNPVTTRNNPIKYNIQWKDWSKAALAPIIRPRIKSAPTIPRHKPRC